MGFGFSCKIDGRSFSNTGSLMEVIDSADQGIASMGGVITEIGPICGVCAPAYGEALDIGKGVSGGTGRVEFLSEKLGDPEFVADSIRRHVALRVRGIVDEAVQPGVDDDAYSRMLRRLLTRGVRISQYDDSAADIGSGLQLSKAIGCMNEGTRTFRYIQAIQAALQKLELEMDEIEFVDAGCGPVPVFGIMAALNSVKTKVVCLEVNPVSARMAQNVISNLGLADRITVLNVDARSYKHCKSIDLLVSETMYAGLVEEPMVDILNNLVSQCSRSSVIIPESITVKAGLIPVLGIDGYSVWEDFEIDVFPADLVHDYGEVAKYKPLRGSVSPVSGGFSFSLPRPNLPAGTYQMTLASDVLLFGDLKLSGLDSTITKPTRVGSKFELNDGITGEHLLIDYAPGVKSKAVEVRLIK